ncbi:MAG: Omp28-related outer membrane protein [Crocinitomicaceae bacterium]|nr:Omp28-related outer membrane protein [Crocinitomicaceae bacterium]
MKRITLAVSAVLLALGAQSQIMSENFDALNVGDYMGTVSPTYWTTWSGAVGGAEDVQVTDAEANSGSNSIYFSSTGANGGPQDVVIDFGQQFTDGIFTYESAMYVASGGNAYFNFQATQTIGQTWAMNLNADGGTISIDDGLTANLAVGSYTADTWFTVEIEANLTLNLWKAYIDGVEIGTWTNGVNTIASADIFPINGSDFYVDDVSFDHQPYTLPNNNAAVSGLAMGSNIVGVDAMPTVTVVNAGANAITSFDVTVDYNGNQYTENVTGQNLTSTSSMNVIYTTAIPLVAGNMNVTATVSNVNGGGADDDPTDDAITIAIDPVVPAAGKMVVGEEATGTWCQWCPRGAVFMDQFEQDFGPFWAGVAVHNGDPMVVATYDSGIGPLIGGYPSALVDRGADVDPSAMTNDFYDRLQTPPTAFLSTTSTWDAATRELVVTVTADFQAAGNSNYKLACVLTEDGVTGTGSGYNQSNAYAGGGNGVMGGYELLPSSVPAAQMVYDHVARAIEPSFGGDATSFPATVNAGEVHSKDYTFTLPVDWDEQEIHIVGMMMDPNGRIDNATSSAIHALASLSDLEQTFQGFSLYPNPASTVAVVKVELEATSDVQLRLIDMSGKEVAARNYGAIEASSTIQLNTAELNAGVYLVELTVNGQRMTKRLVIE